MSLDASAYITLQEAKAFLKKTDATDDTVLESLINATCALISKFIGRAVLERAYELKLSGRGGRLLSLGVWPVSSIESVNESGLELIEGESYSADLERGYLWRLNEHWSVEPQDIIVRCTAGWAINAIPADLKTATLIQISAFWQRFQTKSWGEISRSIAGQNVQLSDEPMLGIVKNTLSRYRGSPIC